MSYENKISRFGYETGAAVRGIEVGKGGGSRPVLREASADQEHVVVEGDELVGTACTYGTIHVGKGGRKELFVQGCFARTLASNQAVRLLIDHDEMKLIATRADALSLASDDAKLTFRCNVEDTRAGRQMKQAVTEGGRKEVSVGYMVEESFDRNIYGESVKFVTDARLLEISLVRNGAVPGTSASIRSSTDDPLLKALNKLGDVLDDKYRTIRSLCDFL